MLIIHFKMNTPWMEFFLDARLKGAWFIRHVDEVRNSMLINHKGAGNLYVKEALGLWPTK
jgi:hypothetical protein